MSGNFTDDFRNKISDIESRGKAVGLNMTTICRQANISRATPDRWKVRIPKTIEILTDMERIVANREAEASS